VSVYPFTTPDGIVVNSLVEESALYYSDPYGWVLWAFPWDSESLKGFGGPDDWAKDYLMRLGDEVKKRGFDGSTAVPAIRMATTSGHGIGKTTMTAWIILWTMSTRSHCKGVVTANTSTQLESKTWSELNKWNGLSVTGKWFTINSGKGALRIYHNDFSETWRCDAITCREEQSEAFAGLHAANSTPFYIFDEASAVPDIIWKVAEGGLTDGEPHMHVFGNPTRNSGAFSECFTTMKHRWICRAVDSRTVKITNKTQIQEWLEDYGEDSDFFRVRVRGVFPRAGNTQFIAGDVVEGARKRAAYYDFNDPCVIACDVARFGSDSTTILVRRGRDARSVPWVILRGLDTMAVAQRIIDLAAVHKPDAIMVDGGGVGGGVVDRLRMLKQPVLEVQFGASAETDSSMVDGAVRYYNKRAEIYGRMREWLVGGSIPDDVELSKELTAVEYGYAMKGGHDCILLEKKEDMKKRLGFSPDRADALAISFAFNVVPSDHYETFNSRRKQSNFVATYDPLDSKYIMEG
jgi:hypothetical protein